MLSLSFIKFVGIHLGAATVKDKVVLTVFGSSEVFSSKAAAESYVKVFEEELANLHEAGQKRAQHQPRLKFVDRKTVE